MKRTLHAFSILETLLAMMLMTMLVAIPFSLNSNVVYRTQADSAQIQIGHAIRTAELYAMQSKLNDAWGIFIQSQTVTVFKGTSYAIRDASYDEVYTYDTKTTLTVTSGSSIVYFYERTGIPTSSVSVSISNGGGSTKTVSLSANGALTYN